MTPWTLAKTPTPDHPFCAGPELAVPLEQTEQAARIMDSSDPSQTEAKREERRVRRRRSRPASERFDNTIPSPCISVCQIDDAMDHCIGCFRSIDEIREWPIMTAAEKTETLQRIAERRSAAGR